MELNYEHKHLDLRLGTEQLRTKNSTSSSSELQNKGKLGSWTSETAQHVKVFVAKPDKLNSANYSGNKSTDR